MIKKLLRKIPGFYAFPISEFSGYGKDRFSFVIGMINYSPTGI